MSSGALCPAARASAMKPTENAGTSSAAAATPTNGTSETSVISSQ